MRKLLTCFFAIALVAPAAMAVDAAVSRAIPTSGDVKNTENSARAGTTRNNNRKIDSDTATRNAISRVFAGSAHSDDGLANARTGIITRAVSQKRINTTQDKLSEAVNTVGRNTRVSSASINSNPSVRRAGLTLRPSTAEVGGRATIGDTGIQTGSNIDEEVRSVQSRATKQATAESIAEATQRLEQTATLNKSCQEQFNECMDQFCAVVDANQGRCSCSSNLSRYTKVESAVKDANAQLNEVAQRIRYVGLSADEIRAIMTETEAEEALSGAVDTSETRNMLEQIEDLIRDPVSQTSYASDSYTGLDMDLDFTSDTADLFSLDFLNTDTGSSFSNLRGTDLYNAAKRRCNTIITQCKGAGATANQITGNYDLAIDKDCIAYERGLVKMNETLVSNVRSANRMLQKARLAVLQNKNQYDVKGCIAALETCMKDDMVCGDDYFKCVDPTKNYIDENGQVVLGQKISDITKFMASYNNANFNKNTLPEMYKLNINTTTCSEAGTGGAQATNGGQCIAAYLLKKIGTMQNVTDEGLCRAVLDKCQRYTYNAEGVYQPYNDVVVNYIQRALVNIRAAQQNIISDYASSCMLDVAACYNQQVTQVNAWSSTASVKSIYNVMRGACRNVALTCAYAVFNNSDVELCYTDPQTEKTACSVVKEGKTTDEQFIEGISEMFYQSLLCPDNSEYQPTAAENTDIGNKKPYVNAHCKCKDGYEAWGSGCVVTCTEGSVRNEYGTCVVKTTTQ